MSDHSAVIDPSTPVLVGLGAAHHLASSSDLVDPIDMMERSTREAIDDTGIGGRRRELLDTVGLIAVPEGDWAFGDPAAEVAKRIGCTRAATMRVDVGVSQHTPIAEAMRRIRAGVIETALIVGGEAKASQLALKRSGAEPAANESTDRILAAAVPDERLSPQGEIMAQSEIDVGMWSAVEHYACIEAALRHAEGRSVAENLDEVAELWQRFNGVAQTNPDAAFGEPRTFEFLRAAGPGNRPLAFPYAKWHSTQWAVDQSAAVLLCSVGTARELGISSDRWLFARVALESSQSVSLSKRARMDRWPAMGVLGAAATEHLGRGLDEIEHVELYSCFPSAVRVQQRELGLDPAGIPTVTGGMAFAGGPFNNFSYQATCAIGTKLREDPGSLGLVTTVSGLLTKPALCVWSTEPGPSMIDDLAAEATLATETREVIDTTATGGLDEVATIATYTATHDGAAVSSMFVIADLADGRRWVGRSEQPAMLEIAETNELIGIEVRVKGQRCEIRPG